MCDSSLRSGCEGVPTFAAAPEAAAAAAAAVARQGPAAASPDVEHGSCAQLASMASCSRAGLRRIALLVGLLGAEARPVAVAAPVTVAVAVAEGAAAGAAAAGIGGCDWWPLWGWVVRLCCWRAAARTRLGLLRCL